MLDDKNQLTPIDGLIDTLELLLAQARAYERALPADNFQARAAVATLGELAVQALNDAHELSDYFAKTDTSEHTLSPREIEVLSLAAGGLTNKEIAYRLGISDRTVQFHMNSIFNKTNTNSRTGAVALGVRNAWFK